MKRGLKVVVIGRQSSLRLLSDQWDPFVKGFFPRQFTEIIDAVFFKGDEIRPYVSFLENKTVDPCFFGFLESDSLIKPAVAEQENPVDMIID